MSNAHSPTEGYDKPATVVATPAPLVIDGFEMLEPLGRGGMGFVCKARQVALDRLVAIKMLIAGAAASAVELARFRAEAEIISHLQHPNLVTVFAVGDHDGTPFIAMELVEGGSLADKLSPPLPPVEAARLTQTLARALHAVHQRGIVHRDLKPGNVLMTRDGVPKITDFGIAKRQEQTSNMTVAGTVLGTPGYMAPEQAQGKAHEVGPPADLHALGAILYETLVGRPPYIGDTPWQVIENTMHLDPVPPRKIKPHVPLDLETICLKCLRKDPRQRYQDARAVADDLHRFLDGEPIEARPTPTWERLLMWVRRHPTLASMTVLSFLCLAALLVGGGVYQVKLRDANFRAEQRLVQMSVLQGARALDEGNNAVGLVHLVEALKLDAPANAWRHRVRIATVLRDTPRLRQLWFHQGPTRVLVPHPDGKRVLTAGELGNVYVRDLDGRGDGTLVGTHHSGVVAGVFVGDRRVVVGCLDGSVHFHDLDPRRHWEFPRHDGAVTRLRTWDDGRRLLTASTDGWAKAWRTDAPSPPLFKLPHPAAVTAADVSADGRLIVTGDAKGTIRLWNGDDGSPRGSVEVAGGRVEDVRVSPAGRWVAACSGKNVHLIDATAPAARTWTRHADLVVEVRFSPDGSKLASSSDDSTARVWSVPDGAAVGLPLAHTSGVNTACFDAAGARLLTGSDDNTARLWHVATGEPRSPQLRHNGSVHHVLFGRGDAVLTGSHDHTARLWDLARPADPEAVPEVAQAKPAGRGRWVSPDESLALTAEGDHAAQLWRADGEPVGGPLAHGSQVLYATFLADNRRVLTASDDNLSRVWETATGALVGRPLAHRGTVRLAAFDTTGRLVVTAAGDRVGRVWDCEHGVPLTPMWKLPGAARSAAFSSDGWRVSLYFGDGVRTWDLQEDRRPKEELEKLAAVLSGHEVTERYGLMPIAAKELERLWGEVGGR